MGTRAGMGSRLNKESLLVTQLCSVWGEPEKFYCEEGRRRVNGGTGGVTKVPTSGVLAREQRVSPVGSVAVQTHFAGGRAGHQLVNGIAGRFVLVQDGVNLLSNRYFHSILVRQA